MNNIYYKNTLEGSFISRPNRFIANVEVEGRVEVAHVKNTGRCKELLISGARVILQRAENEGRKTKYDLISVWKGERLVNIDSSAPNKAFHEHLEQGDFIQDISHIRPETKYKNSRFDFYVEAKERKIFIEVKGVTLEENGLALFPDAPTLRGVKHLNELSACLDEGYEAIMVFIIQMKGVEHFTANIKTHPEFAETLKKAARLGVQIAAFDCFVSEKEMLIQDEVPVVL